MGKALVGFILSIFLLPFLYLTGRLTSDVSEGFKPEGSRNGAWEIVDTAYDAGYAQQTVNTVKAHDFILPGVSGYDNYTLTHENGEITEQVISSGGVICVTHTDKSSGRTEYSNYFDVRNGKIICSRLEDEGNIISDADKETFLYCYGLNEDILYFIDTGERWELISDGNVKVYEAKADSTFFNDIKLVDGNTVTLEDYDFKGRLFLDPKTMRFLKLEYRYKTKETIDTEDGAEYLLRSVEGVYRAEKIDSTPGIEIPEYDLTGI